MRPPGYPALIYVLAKIGAGSSWAIVALNCLALAIGCFATYKLVRDSLHFSCEPAQFLTLLTLLSFVMVRNVTFSLSDICFFGASVPCLLGLIRAEKTGGRERLLRLALLIPLVLFCIELRTIGIVLIPAFLWAGMGGATGGRRTYSLIRRHYLLTLLIFFLLVTVAGEVVMHSQYMRFNLPTFRHRGVVRSVVANVRDHTAEWGELLINVPISRLPAFAPLPVRILGALAIFTCGMGIWLRRRSLDGLMLYVLGYAAIVFAYPWFDTRLWLPVIPFLMAYAWIGAKRLIPVKICRISALVYCSFFCLLGIIALAYSTRLTFAGSRFPELFGDGRLRATYQYALRGKVPADPEEINQDALYLLRRYEWRISGR